MGVLRPRAALSHVRVAAVENRAPRRARPSEDDRRGRDARGARVNHLDFLLSSIYDSTRVGHPAHMSDLRKSGLSDETIRVQKITDIPPSLIDQLLGFATPKVVSAYLIPFADPRGDWMDHIRMKVFPTSTTNRGTTKYLQPKRSGVRIFFPLASLDAVLHSDEPLYIVEGEKKSLSVAQLGLPTVGICGIEGWHLAGTADLHPDLDDVGLRGRVVTSSLTPMCARIRQCIARSIASERRSGSAE